MPTFADTSYFVALMRPKDPWHPAAVQLLELAEARAPLHTTALVLAEVVAQVGSFQGGKAAVEAYQAIVDECVLHLPTMPDLDASMRTVLKFDGKVSLCDAYTLLAMTSAGARDVLSFDKDFDGKGVHRLSASPGRR